MLISSMSFSVFAGTWMLLCSSFFFYSSMLLLAMRAVLACLLIGI
jgi:hypothetical protein